MFAQLISIHGVAIVVVLIREIIPVMIWSRMFCSVCINVRGLIMFFCKADDTLDQEDSHCDAK